MASHNVNRKRIMALPGIRKCRHRALCFRCRALKPQVVGGPFPKPSCVDCALRASAA